MEPENTSRNVIYLFVVVAAAATNACVILLNRLKIDGTCLPNFN